MDGSGGMDPEKKTRYGYRTAEEADRDGSVCLYEVRSLCL